MLCCATAVPWTWVPSRSAPSPVARPPQARAAVRTGVMRGRFTRPMPDGGGGHIPSTGNGYASNMATVGIGNRRKHYLDEEFLFWDNKAFYSQIGVA